MFGQVSVFCVCRSHTDSLLYIVGTVVVMSAQCCFPYTQAYLYYFNCDNSSLGSPPPPHVDGEYSWSVLHEFCSEIL